jgi:hypothetical protein
MDSYAAEPEEPGLYESKGTKTTTEPPKPYKETLQKDEYDESTKDSDYSSEDSDYYTDMGTYVKVATAGSTKASKAAKAASVKDV